jgi:hypothetical protein
MFFDTNPTYTETDINLKKQLVVKEFFIRKDQNSPAYSTSNLKITDISHRASYSFTIQRRATSNALKKSMFKMSSKGIIASLGRNQNG